MKLHSVRLPVTVFSTMPDDDRGLLVLYGHILNEVNALNRLLACAARIEPGPTWLVHAGSAQAFLLAKLQIGKLYEGWKATKDAYFSTKLSRTYGSLIGSPATEGIAKLKAYFGRKNVITSVRNGFAFHYSVEVARQPIAQSTEPEELAFYLHEHVGNSLYHFSEFVMNGSLLQGIDAKDIGAAMNRMLIELNEVTSWLNDFAQGVMIAILDRHVGLQNLHKYSTEVDVPNAPRSAEVSIPAFIVFPPRQAPGFNPP
jgi:hypothetical protein